LREQRDGLSAVTPDVTPLGLLVAAAFGLAIGSFLNVVIYRLPRGESLSFPSSHCTTCAHPLGWRDNVPLVSWIALRGRCRYCCARISPRYPLVELMTAALFCLSLLAFGASVPAVTAALLGALLVVIAFIDLDHLLVLDGTTIAAAVVGVAAAALMHRLLPALEGAACGIVLFGVIYVATRGAGMGLGDVKLAAVLGLFLGYPLSVAAFLAAFVIGAALAIPVVLARRRSRRDALPFGPFLVMAATAATFAPALFAGALQAYRGLFPAY
jgi:leader peptidase (prepilin peptidase) / N-methyltransferase